MNTPTRSETDSNDHLTAFSAIVAGVSKPGADRTVLDAIDPVFHNEALTRFVALTIDGKCPAPTHDTDVRST